MVCKSAAGRGGGCKQPGCTMADGMAECSGAVSAAQGETGVSSVQNRMFAFKFFAVLFAVWKETIIFAASKQEKDMAEHNDLGRRGEELAAEYLQEHGYCILERDWQNMGRKELDIVATKDDVVVFVEVKTRRVGSPATPFEAVGSRKQHRLCLAADSYLKTHRIECCSRFDVIGIITDGSECRVEHIENAFRVRPKFY